MNAAHVTLVDADDRELGTMEKLAAHAAPGHLHRAFSVMLVDADDRVLLHRRATTKYHFGGRWTNTCCSHPAPGDGIVEAARRRLRFEMGVDSSDLRTVGRFEYLATDPASGLVEHELDHVVVGTTRDVPRPNPAEVDAFRWVDLDAVVAEVERRPDEFTPWLPCVLDVLGRRDPG